MIAVNTSYNHHGVWLRVTGQFDRDKQRWFNVVVHNPNTHCPVELTEQERILAVDKLNQAAGVCA